MLIEGFDDVMMTYTINIIYDIISECEYCALFCMLSHREVECKNLSRLLMPFYEGKNVFLL